VTWDVAINYAASELKRIQKNTDKNQ